MKYLKAKGSFDNKTIKRTVDCFKKGGVVVYPTDTVYGIGCLATDQGVIDRIYSIKKRGRDKPFLVLVSDISMAKDYFKINKEQESYLAEYWPGPYSFLLNHKGKLAQKDFDSLVVRLPKNNFLTKIIKELDCPITSTSLNLSGDRVVDDLVELDSYFDLSLVDLVLDVGPVQGKPSSVVDIRDIKNIKILRE